MPRPRAEGSTSSRRSLAVSDRSVLHQKDRAQNSRRSLSAIQQRSRLGIELLDEVGHDPGDQRLEPLSRIRIPARTARRARWTTHPMSPARGSRSMMIPGFEEDCSKAGSSCRRTVSNASTSFA